MDLLALLFFDFTFTRTPLPFRPFLRGGGFLPSVINFFFYIFLLFKGFFGGGCRELFDGPDRAWFFFLTPDRGDSALSPERILGTFFF